MSSADFVKLFAARSPVAWETAALAAARSGEGVVRWPLVPVTLTDPSGRKLVIHVTSDYFAIGDSPNDALRLPLTPLTAQRIADIHGMLLPTTRIARSIYAQSPIRLGTGGLIPNKGPNLSQYAEHNAKIQTELAGRQGLVSGHKKDIVVGQPRPGKVLIYGWPKREAVIPMNDLRLMATAEWRVQPYSPVHADSYVDYSHGVRLVSPQAELDGNPIMLADVLRNPSLAHLASDEGPIASPRYPVGKGASPVAYIPLHVPFADKGLSLVQSRTLERLSVKRSGT